MMLPNGIKIELNIRPDRVRVMRRGVHEIPAFTIQRSGKQLAISFEDREIPDELKGHLYRTIVARLFKNGEPPELTDRIAAEVDQLVVDELCRLVSAGDLRKAVAVSPSDPPRWSVELAAIAG